MIAQELRRLCEMREIEAEIHPWDSGAQLLKDLESYEIQLYILGYPDAGHHRNRDR